MGERAAGLTEDARVDRADGRRPADAEPELDGVTVRMHWTNEPYRWHVNDGSEVFVVLSGVVDMRFEVGDETRCVRLEAGDIFLADDGDAHVAEPVGEARVLVIERAGSV